jgi:hypothetical protein
MYVTVKYILITFHTLCNYKAQQQKSYSFKYTYDITVVLIFANI